MALPAVGPLSSGQIRAEFGGVIPMKMSAYYRGGPNVPDTPPNALIPSSGKLPHSSFRAGKPIPTPGDFLAELSKGIDDFTRVGQLPAQTIPVAYRTFTAWAPESRTIDCAYKFNGAGYASTTNSCTVVIAHAGREPEVGTILSVMSNGGNASFTKIYTYKSTAGSNGGDVYDEASSFIVYTVACDRRDIVTLNIRHTSKAVRYASTAIVTVLPGDTWRPIGLKTNILCFHTTIGPGECAIVAGTAGYNTQWNADLGGMPQSFATASLYSWAHVGVYPANTAPRQLGIQMNGAPHVKGARSYFALILKMIPAGSSPEDHDRLQAVMSPVYHAVGGIPVGRGIPSTAGGGRNEAEWFVISSSTMSHKDLKVTGIDGRLVVSPLYPGTLAVGSYAYTCSVTVRTTSGRIIRSTWSDQYVVTK